MNTVTIAILVVCATAAYASALPDNSALQQDTASAGVAPPEELEGQESRWSGGGGGYNRGGYNRGGGGYYRGGGGYHG